MAAVARSFGRVAAGFASAGASSMVFGRRVFHCASGKSCERIDITGSITSTNDDLNLTRVVASQVNGKNVGLSLSAVLSDVTAKGNVRLWNSTVDGNVLASGNVTFENSRCNSRVEVAGSVTLLDHSRIGSGSSDEAFTITDSAVDTSFIAQGPVKACRASISGRIVSEGELQLECCHVGSAAAPSMSIKKSTIYGDVSTEVARIFFSSIRGTLRCRQSTLELKGCTIKNIHIAAPLESTEELTDNGKHAIRVFLSDETTVDSITFASDCWGTIYATKTTATVKKVVNGHFNLFWALFAP